MNAEPRSAGEHTWPEALNVFARNFSRDGTHDMPWSELLGKDIGVWLGSGISFVVEPTAAPAEDPALAPLSARLREARRGANVVIHSSSSQRQLLAGCCGLCHRA
jgi:hypothetical protein